jgi:hypothetical protein
MIFHVLQQKRPNFLKNGKFNLPVAEEINMLENRISLLTYKILHDLLFYLKIEKAYF